MVHAEVRCRVGVAVIVWVLEGPREAGLAAVRRIFEMTCRYWEVVRCRRREGPDYKVLVSRRKERYSHG